MAQLMLSNQQKYVPTLKTKEETVILKPIPFHGDQLFEERARNIQWVYQDGDNEFDRLEGLNTLNQVNENRPSKVEIKKTIRHLKNGRATGPDGIPSETIKADLNTSTKMLHELFGKIWETDEIPDDWKEGHLIKKGDLKECKNWRGIMLLSTAGKVLNRIILERLKAELDKRLRDEQGGFQKERS